MNAVINETLRLYTPSPGLFPRVAKENHKLGFIDFLD
jgi:cytochrome P450